MASLESKAPAVWIVIPHWNGFADTAECLESLQKLEYPAYQVLVVDNGSSDDSPGRLRARFPHVRWLSTGQNLGFAGGCNVGVRVALEQGADYVLLLNNDTVSPPDMLGPLVEEAEQDAAVGIVSPAILDEDGRLWSAGARRQRWTLAAINIGGPGGEDELGSRPREVDYVFGCAMLVKRQVWQQVGLLDTASFMYHEDLDFCLRARAAGFRLRAVPAARVQHKLGASTRGHRPLYRYYRCRGQAWFLQKHRQRAAERAVALLYLVGVTAWRAIRHLVTLDWRSAAECVRGTRDGWMGAAEMGEAVR